MGSFGEMYVIGLLGGVASGKSVVARALEKLGALIIDADRLGHEVLHEPAVKQAARQRWGLTIFDAAGEIDRRRLAEIVFAPPPEGPQQRAYLESLTHPRIEHLARQRLEAAAAAGRAVAVLDAAVLVEAGWRRLCSFFVFVDAPQAVRRSRAAARGWTAAEFAAREAAQADLQSKRNLADVVIDNSGDVEQTLERVNHLWHELIHSRICPEPRQGQADLSGPSGSAAPA